MTLAGQAGSINSLALLGDDQIVSGGGDCTVNVWNVPQERYYSTSYQHTESELLEPSLSLKGHRSSITAVVAVDAEHIASSSGDKLIAVWNLSTGRCTTVLSGHNDPVSAVITLQNGRLASCSASIKLWDLAISDTSGSRATLAARFNARNDSHRRGVALNMSSSRLWSGVKSIFKKGNENDALLVYPTLTTAYPSTVGMFATNFATVDDAGPADGESDQLSRLMSVLFSKGEESPLTELKLRVQDWKYKLRRKKGPNVADWFGIHRGKRIREAMARLGMLIDDAGEKRLTYNRIKDRYTLLHPHKMCAAACRVLSWLTNTSLAPVPDLSTSLGKIYSIK